MKILPNRKQRQQQGVAVVTALLLTTLALTIVSSLFWQQQVQVRSIENQRLRLQTKWILLGALDWAQLILREDFKTSPAVDHPGEPWATTLQETKLNNYVANDKNGSSTDDNSEALLSGSILDAQSRYNLANLATNGEFSKDEQAAFQRLLENLQISPSLANPLAKAIAASQRKISQANGQPGQPNDGKAGDTGKGTDATATQGKMESVEKSGDKEPISFAYLEDLLSVPGYTAEIVQKLRNHVIFLPRVANSITAINVNTASAEVLAARIPGLSVGLAKSMVADPKRGVYFKDMADFRTRRQDIQIPLDVVGLSTNTNFFIVNGKVSLEQRATLINQTLVERGSHLQNGTRIVWSREI